MPRGSITGGDHQGNVSLLSACCEEAAEAPVWCATRDEPPLFPIHEIIAQNWECSSMVVHVLSVWEALGSTNPHSHETNKQAGRQASERAAKQPVLSTFRIPGFPLTNITQVSSMAYDTSPPSRWSHTGTTGISFCQAWELVRHVGLLASLQPAHLRRCPVEFSAH